MEEKNKSLYQFNNDNEWYTRIEDVEYFVQNVFKKIEPNPNVTIWCPFDKESSAFVKAFKKFGYTVYYTHIETGQDFLTYTPDFAYDYIISNPPFNAKAKTLQRIIHFAKPFYLIFGIQWANSGGFVRLLGTVPFKHFVYLARRMKFSKDEVYLTINKENPSFHSMWIGGAFNKNAEKIDILEGFKEEKPEKSKK